MSRNFPNPPRVRKTETAQYLHPARERGTALVAVVMITLLLAGLSIGMLTEALAEEGILGLRQAQMVALEICETEGIRASPEIHAQQDSGTDGIGIISGEHAGGMYVVTSIQAADNADRWVISAKGTYRNVTRWIEVGVRRRAAGEYSEGLFAKDSLTLDGRTQTDAYDSRAGTWQSRAVNSDSGGHYAEEGGHVGSNENIVLHGSSVTVRGNAGDNEAGSYDPPTYALKVNGQKTVKLSGGTYLFTSVSLTEQAVLQVDGPSRIYVTGDLDVSGGGFVNASGKPADLRIFAHPYSLAGLPSTGSHVKIHGGSQAAMALYAPGAALTVHGDDDIFGAFVAKTITIAGNSKFHYDKAPGSHNAYSRVHFERLYWRDLEDWLR